MFYIQTYVRNLAIVLVSDPNNLIERLGLTSPIKYDNDPIKNKPLSVHQCAVILVVESNFQWIAPKKFTHWLYVV